MLELALRGLITGGVYALLAVSLILIWNASGVVNFAQGEWLMFGAFIGAWLVSKLHINVVLALLLTALLVGALGYLLEVTTYHPLRGQPHKSQVIATIGVSVALENLAMVIWGVYPISMPPLFGKEPIHFLGATLLPQEIGISVVTILLLGVLGLVMTRTMFGKQVRAVSNDEQAAQLLGLPVNRILRLTFAASGVIAGIAGFLVAPLYFATTTMGASLLLKTFAAVVVGGFGSIPGALVGGFSLGLIEIFATNYISSAYKDAYAFIILMAVLIVRPGGIFGERVGDKV
ncbi:MAG: amino acid/amide transporter rane protein 1, family [Firmicutes bacterium]|nr:amino acid/amide transporter rane protein 1, family [Bacillota bacterium]